MERNLKIRRRMERLRDEMQRKGVTVYVIPSSDCHESEYVCAHYRAREYMSGFTGSAGTLVVTLEEAGLFTDGRYFIQAKRQLAGTGIRLFRTGEPGVPGPEAWAEEKLAEGGKLGFDGRVMGACPAERLIQAAGNKGADVLMTEDLVGAVWENRPDIPDTELFRLGLQYTGGETEKKLGRVRAEMEKAGADVHVLASLCDIAWLLNLRGRDIPGVPVVLSFLCMTEEACVWYVRTRVVTDEIRRELLDEGIEIREYEKIYEDLERIPEGRTVLLDRQNVNSRLFFCLKNRVQVLDRSNPSELMKAVKNETELQNLRRAHRKEGLAFTKLMYWVKTRAGKERITERSAAEYLEARRMEQGNYLEPSFASICAYGDHAAIVHYTATEESDVQVTRNGMFLVDAGGHYMEGTTDTTRTFVLGEAGREQKRMFTAVCRGNLQLAFAKFLHGCTGYNLDVLCRAPLWQLEADYRHGTGHGVGYLLNVHEGPNAFRFRQPETERAPAVLEAGMVTTDEPGIYIEGEYGIRTENELVCRNGTKNQYGQFMEFEILTLTPVDLDGILPEEMTEQERNWLNAYHRKVYEELSPYMSEEERTWLLECTREI